MAKIPINIKEGTLVKPNQELIAGIDLGTTNSLVAYVKEGVPVTVADKKGKRTLIPSIVHFTPDDQVVVGDEAREKLTENPARTIYSVKRLMGKSYNDIKQLQQYFGYEIIDDDDPEKMIKIRVGDKFFSPVELSAEILKALKKRIEAELEMPVNKVVITVPAYFNDAQRQATRDAGKLAGFDVLRIVNEPTAASLAYGLGNQHSQTIAVYDLGGGTFDISILRIEDGVFEVLSTNGDTFLGGDDFDRCIIDFWLMKNQKEQAGKITSSSQRLRLKAEQAKHWLSGNDQFDFQDDGFDYAISKEQFELQIQPLVQKTIESCKSALKDAKLNKSEIDHVVMVGGSTRVPLVKKAVSEFFGKPVFDKLDPDEVVALGAAIQADVLAGNQKDLLLLDITPLSLGIETMGGLMDTIIPRNTKVPAKAGRQYTTSVDGQKNLKIAVYQGERDLVEHNRKLGEFILQNIPPMPAGLPKIAVDFIVNADGILQVRAKELRSGVEQAIDIKPTYGITEEDMARMLLDSIQHAQEDMKIRGLLEARNEASHLILSAEKFLSQNEGILGEAEKITTLSLVNNLKELANKNNKDAINKAIQALNEYTTPLAHRSMDKTILEAMKGKKVQ